VFKEYGIRLAMKYSEIYSLLLLPQKLRYAVPDGRKKTQPEFYREIPISKTKKMRLIIIIIIIISLMLMLMLIISLKPERWGSPLVQEKYQEEKACDKRRR